MLVLLAGMQQIVQLRYAFEKYTNILTLVIVTLTAGTLPVEGVIAIIMVVALFIGCRVSGTASLRTLGMALDAITVHIPVGSAGATSCVGVPLSLLMVLGAAIRDATYSIPAWEVEYNLGDAGAVLGYILTKRFGNFGRFVLVVLGLSVLGTCIVSPLTFKSSCPGKKGAAYFPLRFLLRPLSSASHSRPPSSS
ncbi:hypothetical protein F5Y16DRAFT_404794 [Xylariaceae sp. FL0255]|nr:hypothetical protein F5Y16DRAFT_404794 [Xylariaceae sp. FL0255]